MRDLTQGSITGHLLGMAAFIAVGIVAQTLQYLVDLYFVAQLGPAAIAGVGAAGNIFFLVLAASQIVGIGGLALLAQAAGRKASAEADLAFNQTLSMSLAFAAATLVIGYAGTHAAVGTLAADETAAAAGRAYLYAFLPGLALMFPNMALSSALRAAGVTGWPMVLQVIAVALNVVLAPVLIAGWGTGVPLGAAGAGLATTIAGSAGLAGLLLLFPNGQSLVRLHPGRWAPNFDVWRRIFGIGLPSAGEFLIMFFIGAVSYWAIRRFGAEAQAGYGIGARLMQAVVLPAMAIAFAAAPIAGQNFGAKKPERVRRTFRQAALIGAGVMISLTLLCQVRPELMARPFTDDPETLAVAAEFLHIVSWNFVAIGIVFTCSSIFQGLGDTRPSFVASIARLVGYVVPAVWLAQHPQARLHDFWVVSVAAVFLQCAVSLLFLRRVFRKKLAPEPQPAAA